MRGAKSLVVTGARKCVRDHAPRDPLALPPGLYVGDPVWDYVDGRYVERPATRDDTVIDRLKRLHARRSSHPIMGDLTVEEVLRGVWRMGLARDIDPQYARSEDEIVVEYIYSSRGWRAIYGITPDGDAVCWYD